jgi:hypothetical protein
MGRGGNDDAVKVTRMDLSKAGRIFQNPKNRRELWGHIGFNIKGQQIYPPWEPALGTQFSESDYNKIMDAMKAEFENPPFEGSCGPMCALQLCVCSCGLCFCPMLYIKQKVSKFNEGLFAIPGTMNIPGFRIEMTEMADPQPGNWVDSKGQPLLHPQGKHGAMMPLGPPLGYNVIFTFQDEVNPWPPAALSAPVPQVMGQVVGAQDPSQKIMSLKQLLDAGAITQEEFETKKQEILSQM